MKLTLTISDALYDDLDLQAPEGEKLEKFVARMLPVLLKINHERPYMILSGDHLQRINALFGGHVFKDGNDLVETLTRTQTFRMPGSVEIVLEQDLITQLKQQSLGMGIEYERYLKDNLNEALMFLVGIPIQHFTVPGER